MILDSYPYNERQVGYFMATSFGTCQEAAAILNTAAASRSANALSQAGGTKRLMNGIEYFPRRNAIADLV